jgi:hypothetical protein
MTISQLYLFNGLYLVIFMVVAWLTRANCWRIAGAVAGAAVFGIVALGLIALGEHAGLWHMVIVWQPYYLLLMLIDFALCGFIYLITWRIARRFGWRGLAVVLIVVATLGPVRDYEYLQRFPEWGSYAPGPAPLLAVSAIYVLMIVLGHGVMWLIAGPSRSDALAGGTK